MSFWIYFRISFHSVVLLRGRYKTRY